MTFAEVSQWVEELVPALDERTEAGHVCLLAWPGIWTIGVHDDPEQARFAAKTKAVELRMGELVALVSSQLLSMPPLGIPGGLKLQLGKEF